jgi:hypothetical protein
MLVKLPLENAFAILLYDKANIIGCKSLAELVPLIQAII